MMFQFADEALAMLIAAFSKLVPRALQKKVTSFRSSDADTKTISETNVCHIVLLDDTELKLQIRVSSVHHNMQLLHICNVPGNEHSKVCLVLGHCCCLGSVD